MIANVRLGIGCENGYQVITLSNCVAATSAEEHENAIRFDYPMFSGALMRPIDTRCPSGEHRGERGIDTRRKGLTSGW
jgi:hypothetical protein